VGRQSDDVTTTSLTIGVTLGVVVVVAAILFAGCLVCRRRRRQPSAQPAGDGGGDGLTGLGGRADPEAAENGRNESSSSAQINNEATLPSGRYSKDGSVVLTVKNYCKAKNNNAYAAAAASPGKPSVSAISDDLTQYSHTITDDVNVWPYGEAGALCGAKHHDDYCTPRLRCGADDVEKYFRNEVTSPLREDDELRSSCDRTKNR